MPTKSAGRAARPTPRRLSEQVATAIQDELIKSRRRPGDQLPTEPELAAKYDVSRTVIREAGRLLVERGLVDIRPGRGMVVAAFDGANMARQYGLMLEMEHAQFEDLIEMRLVLEVSMTEFAARRRTESDLAAIDAKLRAFAEPGLQQDQALEFDLDFHAAIAEAAHNPFFRSIVNPINDYLRSKYRPSLGYGPARERTLREHTAIAQAVRAGDAEAAGEMSRQHLLRILQMHQELVQADTAETGRAETNRVERP